MNILTQNNQQSMTSQQIAELEKTHFLDIAKESNGLTLLMQAIESGVLSHSKAMEIAMYGVSYITDKCVKARLIMSSEFRTLDGVNQQAYRDALEQINLAKTHLRATLPAFSEYPLAHGVLSNLADIIPHYECSAVIIPSMATGDGDSLGLYQNTYFMLNPVTGMIKIGKSCDAYFRKQALQCGAGAELKIIAIIEKNIESTLHKRFEKYRFYGEWFDDRDGLIKRYINEHADKKWRIK